MVVDLGSGSNPRNAFGAKHVVGVDIFDQSPFTISEELSYRTLAEDGRIPFADGALDAVTAFDVIEHLPRQSSARGSNHFINTMNEVHRVLKPGGLFLAVTPCFPSPAAFQDPTHVNIITTQTHRYFSDDVWARSKGYGFIGSFSTVSSGWYPWVGSWIANTPFRSQANETPRALRLLRAVLIFFVRTSSLTNILIFPKRRTHFLWLLEK
jgi:SAM-dependent methyltransferase